LWVIIISLGVENNTFDTFGEELKHMTNNWLTTRGYDRDCAMSPFSHLTTSSNIDFTYKFYIWIQIYM